MMVVIIDDTNNSLVDVKKSKCSGWYLVFITCKAIICHASIIATTHFSVDNVLLCISASARARVPRSSMLFSPKLHHQMIIHPQWNLINSLLAEPNQTKLSKTCSPFYLILPRTWSHFHTYCFARTRSYFLFRVH